MTTTELQIDEELIDVGSGNETEVAGPGRADRSVPSDPASSAEHA